jgi:4-diphosphocytidyl-2-C-methyl-D-erythritol kinase
MALAWGRGERMLALPALPVRRVQLVVPSFGVVTADAYRWLAESRPAYAPAGALLDAASFATWDGVAAMATNDFEGPAEARHVELARYREALARAGAQVAMLSGSGSTVFGVLGDRAPGVAGDDVPGARVIETTTAGSVVPVQVLV